MIEERGCQAILRIEVVNTIPVGIYLFSFGLNVIMIDSGRQQKSFFDRVFRDDAGNIVIAQVPNLPILVWLAASLLSYGTASGKLHQGLAAVAFGALFTWAWQELFDGVNYFRRSLGLGVLLGAIAWQIYGA